MEKAVFPTCGREIPRRYSSFLFVQQSHYCNNAHFRIVIGLALLYYFNMSHVINAF